MHILLYFISTDSLL